MEDFIFNWMIRREVKQARSTASAAGRDARRSRESLDVLEERVGRMTLLCAALTQLMKNRLGVTDDELMAVLDEIDGRDGNADGKLEPSSVDCPGCGRANGWRRARCLYCGDELPRGTLP